MMGAWGCGSSQEDPQGTRRMGTRSSQADINHEPSHMSSAVFYHVLSRTKGEKEVTPQLLRSVAFLLAGVALPSTIKLA